MIHKKNVIYLGILDSDTILESGQLGKYYIYYKSDKDLYMYDSYNDVETNLFDLQRPSKGKLEITCNKLAKSFLQIFATKSTSSKLEITATKTLTTVIPEQGLTVNVRVPAEQNRGTLSITADKSIGVGIIDITVMTPVLPN